MQATSTIAVIGATGPTGSGICKRLSGSGHRIICCGEQLEQVHTLLREIRGINPDADVDGMDCAIDASWEADIIVLATPESQETALAARIKDVVSQKIVISLFNPLPLQQILPYSRVIGRQAAVSDAGFPVEETEWQTIRTVIGTIAAPDTQPPQPVEDHQHDY